MPSEETRGEKGEAKQGGRKPGWGWGSTSLATQVYIFDTQQHLTSNHKKIFSERISYASCAEPRASQYWLIRTLCLVEKTWGGHQRRYSLYYDEDHADKGESCLFLAPWLTRTETADVEA